MLRTLRFSILEMLWICSVFATFLYLNLVMTPIEESSTTMFSGKEFTYIHRYESHTGWPLPYFSLRYESPPDHFPIDASVDQITAMEKAHASDIDDYPWYTAGKTKPQYYVCLSRPKLTEVWGSGKLSWAILINVLAGLLVSFAPLAVMRRIKQLRKRKQATVPTSSSVT